MSIQCQRARKSGARQGRSPIPVRPRALMVLGEEPGQEASVGVQQGVGQTLGQRILADQWVRHEGPNHRFSTPVQGGLDGEALIGLAVGHQPGHVRRKVPLLERVGAVPVDETGDFDDGVVGKAGDAAVVAHIDHLHVPRTCVQ